MKDIIYVCGHKNPDADSICSAIGVAYLKNKMIEENRNDEYRHFGLFENGKYIPIAAGNANDETKCILEKFNVPKPEVVSDIRNRVGDMKIKSQVVIGENEAISSGWKALNDEDTNMVFAEDERGIATGIITQKDVAKVYMDAFSGNVLSKLEVKYANILNVLDANLIKGDENKTVKAGNVKIMTVNTPSAEDNIFAGDIILCTYHESKVKFLIERGVGAIILCSSNEGEVSALKADTCAFNGVVASTKLDIFSAARLIGQSIPISRIMKPLDKVVSFKEDEFVDDIRDVMVKNTFREFPVLSSQERILGTISKGSLLNIPKKKVVMVDHNEENQGVLGISTCEVVEIIDHHKLSTVETNRPINVTTKQVGCTATLVFEMFQSSGIDIPKDIAGVLSGAILSDTMFFKSPTCTDDDVEAANKLSCICKVPLDELWDDMLSASLNFKDKADEEIFYQDYKKFSHNGFSFGIGQVMVANEEDCTLLADRIKPYMEREFENTKVDMIGLLITDVSREGSQLVFCGNGGDSILSSAFKREIQGNSIFLEGVVSRKKQIIPQILTVLE